MKKMFYGLLAVTFFSLSGGSIAQALDAKCAMCHGADGKGKAAMEGSMCKTPGCLDLTKGTSDCVTVVTNGRNKMPAYKDKMTPEQIAAACAEVKALPK